MGFPFTVTDFTHDNKFSYKNNVWHFELACRVLHLLKSEISAKQLQRSFFTMTKVDKKRD